MDAVGSMRYELNEITANLRREILEIKSENHEIEFNISGEYVISELRISETNFTHEKKYFEELLVETMNQGIRVISEKVKERTSSISTEPYKAALHNSAQINYSEIIHQLQKTNAALITRMENEIYSFESTMKEIKCTVNGVLAIQAIEINELKFNNKDRIILETELSEMINQAIINIRNQASKAFVERQRETFVKNTDLIS